MKLRQYRYAVFIFLRDMGHQTDEISSNEAWWSLDFGIAHPS